MRRISRRLVMLVLVLSLLLTALPAQAAGSGWYVVESTSPYGYCYLYSQASDRSGRNLGRYENGTLIYVWDYYGGQEGQWNYCYVETQDGKYGYIHDYALTPYSQTAVDYWDSSAPEYVIFSEDPYGYCYLYSLASDNYGQNLGRYENNEVVKVLEYYGGQEGQWNYCKVITQKNKVGYMHDYALKPLYEP